MLVGSEERLALSGTPEKLAGQPAAHLIRTLLNGLIQATTWSEILYNPYVYSPAYRNIIQARTILQKTLASLPVEMDSFYPLDGLSQAIFERVGELFSIDYLPRRPYTYYRKSPAEIKKELADWKQKLHEHWLKTEKNWIRGGAHYLGVLSGAG